MKATCFSLLTIFTLQSFLSLAKPLAYKHEDFLLVSIDKKSKSAELYTLPQDSINKKKIYHFKIALGKKTGDKQKEGDNKTPEGIYFPVKQIKYQLPIKKYGPYGATAFDYPNIFDKMQKKTGHGIWFHGIGDESKMKQPQTTEGCIAFFNEDFKKIKPWIKPYSTVIVIRENSSEHINELEQEQKIHNKTLTWLNYWKKKSLKNYLSLYSTDFKAPKQKNINRFARYKKRIFSSYKKMQIKINNLRVVVHSKYAISFMNQDFYGDKYTSFGSKILYWQKDQNKEWKIIREVFNKKKFTPMKFALPLTKLVKN
jgi:murein L,D-transpeptidase YafK